MVRRVKLNVGIFKRIIWVITILWMGIIFYFSSQPAEISRQASGELLVQMDQIEEEEIQNISDRRVWNLHYFIRKFAHFVLYCGLGFLMVLSIVPLKSGYYAGYLIAWLVASLYGVLDELHQNFVPGRGATLADMKLDAVSAFAGVAAAAAVIGIWKIYNARKKPSYER